MPEELGIASYTETLSFQDKIYFDFKSDYPVSIQDVIVHLEGMQEISKKIPLLLDKLISEKDIKGVTFREPSLKIQRLEAGSLTDWINFAVEMVIMREVDEETKKAVVADIKNMALGWKIALLFGGIAVCGAVTKGCLAPSTTAEYENLKQQFCINIGSSFQIAPEKVQPILQAQAEKATASDRKAGIKFLRPARSSGGSIKLSTDNELEIPDAFIKSTPEEYEPPLKEEQIQILKNIKILFRALDIDKTEQGWGAVIPDVHPLKRLPLKISENIDRSELLSCKQVYGDVEVTYKLSKSGKFPIKAKLLSIPTK